MTRTVPGRAWGQWVGAQSVATHTDIAVTRFQKCSDQTVGALACGDVTEEGP